MTSPARFQRKMRENKRKLIELGGAPERMAQYDMSPYEMKRLQTICDNQQKLIELGLVPRLSKMKYATHKNNTREIVKRASKRFKNEKPSHDELEEFFDEDRQHK